jgi:glutamine amidotransferase
LPGRKKKIQILDYGSGNLFSIKNAIERSSQDVEAIIDSTFQSDESDGLVLPGVGSFASAQRILNENRKTILDSVNRGGMPLLGICLGMQLMFEESEEGTGEGLKIFGGRVMRFPRNSGLKIPHMGWNTISLSTKMPNSRLCRGLNDDEWVYYVHSYYPDPVDERIVCAWTEYGDSRFPAIIAQENVFGAQFHPEKSHTVGARIVSNFVNVVKEN